MPNTARGVGLLIAATLLSASSAVPAQESKSAGVVGELTRALDEMKLTAYAAPHGPDRWVALLYIAGSQLLVVDAKYPVPERLKKLISDKQYQDVYTDLSTASDQSTKMFVMDLGANGLKFKRERDEPFDTVDSPKGSVVFDGEWGNGKISEEDYKKAFAKSDEEYTGMLQALIEAVKKPS